MMSSPFMQLLHAAKNGGDPLALLSQMAGRNPQAAVALKMLQGKSPAQLQQMAQNMAKERGINIEDMARQMGLK